MFAVLGAITRAAMLYIERQLRIFDRDQRCIDVFAILILAGHHDIKAGPALGEVGLSDCLHQCRQLCFEAVLVLREDVVVQKALTEADRIRLQLLILYTSQRAHYWQLFKELRSDKIPSHKRQGNAISVLGPLLLLAIICSADTGHTHSGHHKA